MNPEDQEGSEKLREDDEEDEGQRKSNSDAFLQITLNFLRRMKQGHLADFLQSSKMLLRITYHLWIILQIHLC